MSKLRERAEQIECPYCNAPAGAKCRVLPQNRALVGYHEHPVNFHTARYNAARQSLELERVPEGESNLHMQPDQ